MIADLWGGVGFIGDNTTNIATIEEIQIQKIDKIYHRDMKSYTVICHLWLKEEKGF